MSVTPPPPGFSAAPGPPMAWPPGQSPRGAARWPFVVMFVITLVAVGAAVAAWLRPLPETKSATPTAPTFSDQQVADAKSKVCAAYWKVQNVVSVNVARTAGDDANSQLLIAVNQRQVFVIGSVYLMTTLAEQLATPADLAAAANDLAHWYQVLTLDGLVATSMTRLTTPSMRAGFTIERLCK